jgi:type I restriction enzyme, S subunit
MGDEWKEVSVEEIASKIAMGPFGSDIKTDNFVPDGVPVIRGVNLSSGRFHAKDFVFLTEEKADELSNANAFPGDIVFTHRGTLGQVGLVPDGPFKRYVVSQSQMKLTCDPSAADPTFLFYYFRSPFGQHALLMNTSQTGVPAISRPITSLKSIRLLLPGKAEQRAISEILGTLDEKIELNVRTIETLDAMVQATFQSWFVDFDPVRARAGGGETGLPESLVDLFPSHLADSELGAIPVGWKVGSIYEIADVVYGAPFASAHFNADGIGEPLIRIRDLASESPGVWTPEIHPKAYKVKPGDVIVGMDGEFRAYLWGGVEAWLNQRVCAFVPKEGYSAAFIRNSIAKPLAQVEATETGTTVIHLGKSDIDRFSVVVPSVLVIAAFNQLCQPWYDRVVTAKLESRTLSDLRDTLLPKLISGELRVRDAAKLIGRVTR